MWYLYWINILCEFYYKAFGPKSDSLYMLEDFTGLCWLLNCELHNYKTGKDFHCMTGWLSSTPLWRCIYHFINIFFAFRPTSLGWYFVQMWEKNMDNILHSHFKDPCLQWKKNIYICPGQIPECSKWNHPNPPQIYNKVKLWLSCYTLV